MHSPDNSDLAESELIAEIEDVLQFDRCCSRAFAAVRDGFGRYLELTDGNAAASQQTAIDGGLDLDYRTLADHLHHHSVADGFARWRSELADLTSEPVFDFLQTLVATQRTSAAAAHYLLGRAATEHGDTTLAGHAYTAAVGADHNYPFPHRHLGFADFFRGEYDQSRNHLHRFGLNNDNPIFDFFPPPLTLIEAGRNDPCPCGSERKYKACHLNQGGVPSAPQPNAWQELDRKEVMHQSLRSATDPVLALALTAANATASVSASSLDMERTHALAQDPFIEDLARFEAGGMDNLIELRGELFPAVERALAGQLSTSMRQLYEVDKVEPGHSLDLRNVTTGDHQTVIERIGSTQINAGDYLLARVIEYDGAARIYGYPLPVPLRGRASLLDVLDTTGHGEYDQGNELAHWYGELTAPPTLITTDGLPFEPWKAELHVQASTDDVREFISTFAREDGDGFTELTQIGSADELTIHAQLRIVDTASSTDGVSTVIQVDTFAYERIERVINRFEQAFSTEVVSVESTPIDLNAARSADLGSDTNRDDDPELEAAALSYMLNYEQRWLDESIPLLGGATPREAADDPSRRDDLLRLLKTMPAQQPGQTGMNRDRLGAALGLDPASYTD